MKQNSQRHPITEGIGYLLAFIASVVGFLAGIAFVVFLSWAIIRGACWLISKI